ncbi:unnamed protein product [Effrenium voratum]|nr:unnamed protein product [Effrenium voratum]
MAAPSQPRGARHLPERTRQFSRLEAAAPTLPAGVGAPPARRRHDAGASAGPEPAPHAANGPMQPLGIFSLGRQRHFLREYCLRVAHGAARGDPATPSCGARAAEAPRYGLPQCDATELAHAHAQSTAGEWNANQAR